MNKKVFASKGKKVHENFEGNLFLSFVLGCTTHNTEQLVIDPSMISHCYRKPKRALLVLLLNT